MMNLRLGDLKISQNNMTQNKNIPTYEDWFDDLTGDEYIELLKKYGHYYHDIGASESDWKDMYKQEFDIKDPNSISIKEVINYKQLLAEKDAEIERLKALIKPNLSKKQIALNKVNDEYNDPRSMHYRDNERYAWAVTSINKTFDNLEE